MERKLAEILDTVVKDGEDIEAIVADFRSGSAIPRSPIGKRVVQAIDDSGLSRAEFARRLKVSASTITLWDKGGEPKGKYITLIAKELGKSVEWVLTGVDAPAVIKTKPAKAVRTEPLLERMVSKLNRVREENVLLQKRYNVARETIKEFANLLKLNEFDGCDPEVDIDVGAAKEAIIKKCAKIDVWEQLNDIHGSFLSADLQSLVDLIMDEEDEKN